MASPFSPLYRHNLGRPSSEPAVVVGMIVVERSMGVVIVSVELGALNMAAADRDVPCVQTRVCLSDAAPSPSQW